MENYYANKVTGAIHSENCRYIQQYKEGRNYIVFLTYQSAVDFFKGRKKYHPCRECLPKSENNDVVPDQQE